MADAGCAARLRLALDTARQVASSAREFKRLQFYAMQAHFVPQGSHRASGIETLEHAQRLQDLAKASGYAHVGELRRALRNGGHAQLASRIGRITRARNVTAHPSWGSTVDEVRDVLAVGLMRSDCSDGVSPAGSVSVRTFDMFDASPADAECLQPVVLGTASGEVDSSVDSGKDSVVNVGTDILATFGSESLESAIGLAPKFAALEEQIAKCEQKLSDSIEVLLLQPHGLRAKLAELLEAHARCIGGVSTSDALDVWYADLPAHVGVGRGSEGRIAAVDVDVDEEMPEYADRLADRLLLEVAGVSKHQAFAALRQSSWLFHPAKRFLSTSAF